MWSRNASAAAVITLLCLTAASAVRAPRCAPGTSSANGRQPCLPCGAGTFAEESGSRSCEACPANSASYTPAGAAGPTSCTCNANFYYSETSGDWVNCVACPANMGSAPGASTCTCNPGFLNCGLEFDAGCTTPFSVDSCGACGNVCTLGPNVATVTCNAGTCAIATCNPGYSDCDSGTANGYANGCETALYSDTACFSLATGACPATGVTGADCTVAGLFANAAGVCTTTGAGCGMGACNAGFSDCNNSPADGCEINTNTDNGNCGACANNCGALPNVGSAAGSTSCSAGVCSITTCASGYQNCDASVTNGCESVTAFDAKNCGTCGHDCTANVTPGFSVCGRGTCLIGTGACVTGYNLCLATTTAGGDICEPTGTTCPA